MKAVVLDVSEEELARRRLRGIDRWDEVWQGVLHMAPAPFDEHQRILGEFFAFLLPLLRRSRRGALRIGVNVFNEASPQADYRIPDLTFVAAGREAILAPDGIRGGGPDAVVEIRSPEDETYDKFPFFAGLGVREVVVIGRDTKSPELYRLAGKEYSRVPFDRNGWLVSEVLGVRMRLSPATPPLLVVEDASSPDVRAEI